MAQAVRKFENGGGVNQGTNNTTKEAPETRLFKVDNRNIATDDLIRNASSNLESYLESTGWSRRKKDAFRESYGDYIKAIDSGNISSRDLSRNWIDSSGVLSNTTGRGFDANGAVAHYLDQIVDVIPDYIKPTVEKKSNPKLDFGVGFRKRLSDKIFGGNSFNKSVWYGKDPADQATGKRGISNRWKEYVSIFNEYADSLLNDQNVNLEGTAFQNRDDLIARINAAKEELNNSDYTNADWEKLAALGVNKDDYRDWFGEIDNEEIPKTDNFEGRQNTAGNYNKKATDSGLLARIDDKGNTFYLTPEGNRIQNGIISKTFNPTLDKLEGWYSVDGQLYDPSEYSSWKDDIKNSYNRLLNQKDLNTIWTDPLYDFLRSEHGYTHMLDASSFFEGLKPGELIRAYTKPKAGDSSSYKSQFYQNINGKLVPVIVDYDKNNNQYYINNNGTTRMLGKARAVGSQIAEGSNEKVGWGRINQYSLSNNPYSQENVTGLLKRISSYPELLTNSKVKIWLEDLFKAKEQGLLDDYIIDGKPLSRYIQPGVINAALVPNTNNAPLRAIIDSNGRITGFTFDKAPISKEQKEKSQGYKENVPSFLRPRPVKPLFKKGGIIKEQWGGTVSKLVDTNIPVIKDEKKAKEDSKVNERAADSYNKVSGVASLGNLLNDKPSPEEQALIDAGGIIKTSDKVKLGAAITDLLSAGLGFVPGAHVASAATGAISSAATFGADLSDGFDWSDVGNLGVNLGLDAISLIPGLKTVKAGKALQVISKLVPALSTVVAMSGILDEEQRASISSTLAKVGNLNVKDLNTNDFKNLSLIASTLLGARNYVKAGDSGVAKWIRGEKRLPSQERTIQVLVKGESTPLNVTLKNSQITGKSSEEIKSAAIEAAKKKLVSERGLSKEGVDKLNDDALTVIEGRKKYGLWGERKVSTKEIPGQTYSEQGWFRRALGFTPYKAKGTDKHIFRRISPEYEALIKRKNSIKLVPTYINKNKPGYIQLPKYLNPKTPGSSIPMIFRNNSFTQRGQDMYQAYLKRNQYLSNVGNNYMEPWYNPGAYKKGGKIPKGQNGLITGVKQLKGNWYNDIYTPYSQGLLDSLKSGKITYQDINEMQKRHAGLYKDWGVKGDSYRGDNVKQYQTDINNSFNYVNDKGIRNAFNSGRYGISKTAYTGDNPNKNYVADGYYSSITDDRRLLGREGDYTPEQLQQVRNTWRDAGYNMDLDNTTGYYMLNPLNTPPQIPISEISEIDDTVPEVEATPQDIKSPLASNTKGTQSRNGFNWGNLFSRLNPAAFIGAGRLAGNIWNNNRVAKETIKGLKPLYLDTWEVPRQVVGDLATKQAYYGQAAGLESLAARPRTSDASLQLAGQLEAGNKAAGLRMEGDLIDNQRIRETSEAAWQNTRDAVARRSDVTNRNRASALGIDKAKHDVEAAKKSANWTSIENFLKEGQYNSTLNRDRQKQFQLGVAEQNIQDVANAKLEPLRRQLQAMEDKGEDYTKSPLYQQYQRLVDSTGRDVQTQMNKAYSDIYGWSLPSIKWRARYNKKGGTLTYAERSKLQRQKDISAAERQNAKLFQRTIEKSIDTNIKMINNLSSVSKQLIIKSMTL